MDSFEIFLEVYDTCSKSEVIYNWQQLERKIKDILGEKENKEDNLNYYICPYCKGNLCIKEITEQVIKCGCGVVDCFQQSTDKLKRITYINEKEETIDIEQVIECDNKYQNLVKEVNKVNKYR